MTRISTPIVILTLAILAGCADTHMNSHASHRNPLTQVMFVQSATESQIHRHIEAGTPLNVHNEQDGQTPMLYVLDNRLARYPPPSVARTLRLMLDHGADPNLQSRTDISGITDFPEGQTPLHLAADFGNPDLVRLLLDAGATPNFEDAVGNTPLYLAVRSGNLASVRLLLDAGADPNHVDREGFTTLAAVRKYSPGWRQYGFPSPQPNVLALMRQYGGHE